MSDQVVRQPQQERSRRSLESIYAAAIELLAEAGWDAVTVGEIERRSGVSRGTFYLRFPTRDALVDYVHDRMIAEVRESQETTFAPLMAGGPITIEHAASLAVRGMADVFRNVGRVMAPSARLGTPPASAEAIADLSHDVAVVLRRGVGDGAQATPAIHFAIEICFASFVARQRPVPAFSEHPVISEAEFIHQLSDAVAAYLSARSTRSED